MSQENKPSDIKPTHPMPSAARALKPKLSVNDGEVWTTSMAIAEHFGKNHFDVLRTIRNSIREMPEEFHKRNFAVMSHLTHIGNGATRNEKYYRLSKNGFALIAMGFTGAEALKWKIAYVEAFDYMARSLPMRVPSRSAKDVLDEPRGDAMDSPLFNHVLRALDRKFGQAAVLTYLIEKQGLSRPVSRTLRRTTVDMDRTMSRVGISKVAAKLEERGVLDVSRGSRGFTFSIIRDAFAVLLDEKLIDVPAFLKLADEISGSDALRWYEALPDHSKVLH